MTKINKQKYNVSMCCLLVFTTGLLVFIVNLFKWRMMLSIYFVVDGLMWELRVAENSGNNLIIDKRNSIITNNYVASTIQSSDYNNNFLFCFFNVLLVPEIFRFNYKILCIFTPINVIYLLWLRPHKNTFENLNYLQSNISSEYLIQPLILSWVIILQRFNSFLLSSTSIQLSAFKTFWENLFKLWIDAIINLYSVSVYVKCVNLHISQANKMPCHAVNKDGSMRAAVIELNFIRKLHELIKLQIDIHKWHEWR